MTLLTLLILLTILFLIVYLLDTTLGGAEIVWLKQVMKAIAVILIVAFALQLLGIHPNLPIK